MHPDDIKNKETREFHANLLETAINELPKLHEGEIFTLPDLFLGYEWKRIPLQSRTVLGRYFLDFACKEDGQAILGILGGPGRQRYVRK
ncbi:MAG: single-stranded DNA-binding protein [Oscillospiraceae bacterium]|nr:single-stranded DNA-binding protein [Oscillospiraceae bacterium]